MLPDSLESVLWIIARSLAVYAVVLLAFRLAGKRHLSQLSLPDFALILLISNAVQNAMVGNDTSLVGGIIAALALLGGNLLITKLLAKNNATRQFLIGEPKLLVRNSKIVDSSLHSEGLSEYDLLEAIREHGFESLDEVRTAIIENDGSISIIPYPTKGTHIEHHFGPITKRRRGKKQQL
ncbi:MAG TPA: YetF domain-containing protein [Candidatus Kapabacteria bacterium]|nr:YetF domain-containing protein [Candidatus Kapabacteria bacterium]